MVLIQPLSSLLTEVVWPAGWVDSDPLKVQSSLSKPTLPCSVLMNVFLPKVICGSGYSLKMYKYLKTKMWQCSKICCCNMLAASKVTGKCDAAQESAKPS